MATKRTAEKFAKIFSGILEEHEVTSQRAIAGKTAVQASAVNRLCRTGQGSEDDICAILDFLGLKRRRILEILAHRRSELSHGVAKEMWAGFRYAFIDALDYMSELCPFPLRRAVACTYLGVPLRQVLELVRQLKIPASGDLQGLSLPQHWAVKDALTDKLDGKTASFIFVQEPAKPLPPIVLLDSLTVVDAAEELKLHKCRGVVLYGIPHFVVAHYEFERGGYVESHGHLDSVEFLYSLSGSFEITYARKIYPLKLVPGGSIYALHARRKHSIKLVEGSPGRLLMFRFYPRKRDIGPRRKRKNRASRASDGH